MFALTDKARQYVNAKGKEVTVKLESQLRGC